MGQVTDALAQFQRVLISGASPYDAFLLGDEGALSPAERRGERLFESDRLRCARCHSAFNLSDAVLDAEGFDAAREVPPFHNTGLYDLDGEGSYPAESQGLIALSGELTDMGRFKAPTLRNITLTAPYMHDGSIDTLDEVIDHYAAGGRSIDSGPNRGVGADNPFKDPAVSGFEITAAERRDLLAFLNALTDSALLTAPRLSNPWEASGAPR
jgi:cytochrome c peroxidase